MWEAEDKAGSQFSASLRRLNGFLSQLGWVLFISLDQSLGLHSSVLKGQEVYYTHTLKYKRKFFHLLQTINDINLLKEDPDCAGGHLKEVDDWTIPVVPHSRSSMNVKNGATIFLFFFFFVEFGWFI